MKQIVVGIGEVLRDVFIDKDIDRLGGAPANFAIHAAQFGCDSYVVSAIGADEAGSKIEAEIGNSESGKYIQQNQHPTGEVLVRIDENNKNIYTIVHPCAWNYIEYTEDLKLLAQQTAVVCFGTLAQYNASDYITHDTIKSFLSDTNEKCIKIFDINIRQNYYSKQMINSSLEMCNILKISDEELPTVQQVLGLENENDNFAFCQQLISTYKLRMVVLTCGGEGSVIITPDKEISCKAPLIREPKTVGAGDSFTAAFAVAMLNGFSLEKAQLIATITSAYVCTQDSATPELPEYIRNLYK